MANVIGGAFVTVQPDLAGFQQQLKAGVTQALSGIKKIPGPDIQFELPGLQNKAAQLIKAGVQTGLQSGFEIALPLVTRNTRNAFSESLMTATQTWLPGFSRDTARAATQMSILLGEQTQKAITVGAQLALPLTEESFQRAFARTARDFGAGLVDHAGTAIRGLSTGALAVLGAEGSRVLAHGLASGVSSGIDAGFRATARTIGAAIETAIISPVRAAATTAGLLVAGGLTFGLEAAIGAGSQLDRVRQSFIALTGSATQAQEIITTLRQTTIRSGQDFSVLAASAQQLIASGFQPKIAESVLNTVSQMVTVYGRGIQGLQRASIQLEEIGFKGTVQAQQLNALIRDGVPGYAALTAAAIKLGFAQEGSADATQKAKEAMHDGQITAQAFFEALSDPKVVGNVEKTIQAIQTNVAFQVQQLKTITVHTIAQIAEPVQRTLGAALRPITDQFDRLANDSELLNKIGVRMAVVFRPLIPIFERLGVSIGNMLTILEKGGFDKLAKDIQPFTAALAAVTGGLVALGSKGLASLPLIGGIVPALNPLLGIFIGLAAVTPGIQQGLLSIVGALKPLFLLAGQIITTFADALAPALSSVVLALGPTVTLLVRDLGPALLLVAQAAAPLVTILGQTLTGVIVQFDPILSDLKRPLLLVADAIRRILTAALPLVPVLARLATDLFIDLLQGVLPLVGPLAEIASILVAVLAPALKTVLEFLEPIIPVIAAVIIATKAWAVAQWILNLAMVANPVGATVLLIEALIAALVLLIVNFDTVHGWLFQVWAVMQQVVGSIGDWINQNKLLSAGLAILTGPIGAIIVLAARWRDVFDTVARPFVAVNDAVRTFTLFMKEGLGPTQAFDAALRNLGVPLELAAPLAKALGAGFGQVRDVLTNVNDAVRTFNLFISAGLSPVQAFEAALRNLGAPLQVAVPLALLLGGAVLTVRDALFAVTNIGPLIQAFFGLVVNGLNALFAAAEVIWAKFSARPAFWIGFAIGFVLQEMSNLNALVVGAIIALVVAVEQKFIELSNAVIGTIGGLAVSLGGLWNQIVDTVVAWAGRMLVLAGQAALQFGAAYNSVLDDLPGSIAFILGTVIPVVAGWAGRMIAQGVDAAVRFGAAWNQELNKLPGQALQIGHNVAQGIIDGFMAMLPNAKTAIGQFVQGLIDGAHAAGQKGSGYKTFRPIGRLAVEGVTDGLKLEAPNAVRTMSNVVLAMSDVRMSTGQLAASTASSDASRGPVSVQVNVTNPGASAGDIASEFGWRLAQQGVTV